MMRRFLPLLIALLVLSACGGSPEESPDGKTTSAGADTVKSQLVDWMGKLCAADKPLTSAASSSLPGPTVPKEATEADRKALKTYLRTAVDRVGKTKADLATLPPAPTADSKRLLADYRKDVGSLYSSLFKYAEHAEWFPLDGLQSVSVVAKGMLASFEGVPFQNYPELAGRVWCA
jgi:hypothetical protein